MAETLPGIVNPNKPKTTSRTTNNPNRLADTIKIIFLTLSAPDNNPKKSLSPIFNPP